jgi:hypothetical protein
LLGQQSDRLTGVDEGNLEVPFFYSLCQLFLRLGICGERFWVSILLFGETVAKRPTRELLRPGQILGEIENARERRVQHKMLLCCVPILMSSRNAG